VKIVSLALHRTFSQLVLRFQIGTAFERVVLGRGMRWTSFQLKLSCLHDFVRGEIGAGRGREPFLFIDAYDTIMLTADPRYYASLYRGRPLFAAEMYNWPDKNLRYPEENRSRVQPYLNSGCFLATPDDICGLLEKNEFRHYTNDQLYWAHVYVNNPGSIELDFESRMCACLIACLKDDTALRRSGSDLVFLQRFSNPGVLHFNGPARIKKRMWRWYGYCVVRALRNRVRQGRNLPESQS